MIRLSGLTIYAEQGILKNKSVFIANGKFQAIDSNYSDSSGKKLMTFPSSYSLIPGFIDLHIHGANGSDVMDASIAGLNKISAALAAEGVTGFLATTLSASIEELEKVLNLCAQSSQQNQLDQPGARLLGVHLEGPFIAAEKKGAQESEKLLLPNIQIMQRLQQAAAGSIKIVTLAPELPGSLELIHFLKKQSIIVSLGHTQASFSETLQAIQAGCSHATHLFNAMREIHHRDPGVAAATLLSSDVTIDMIADGIHIHPAMIKLAWHLKGSDKLALITDAMRAKCLRDGQYTLGNQQVNVEQGIARLNNGMLAGSTLTMSAAFKNIMRFTQCDIMDAVKMTSETPAKIIDLFHQKGSIKVGKDADCVVLDEQLNVVMTLVEGRIEYGSEQKKIEEVPK